MAQIPDQSGVPQVSATPTAPNDYQNIRSSPEDFGAAVAQGTQKLGQGVSQAGGDMTDVLVQRQNRQNEIGVDDTMQDFQNKVLYKTFGGDPANPTAKGLYQLHGKAAMDAGPGVANDINNLRNDTSKNLNPAQKILFDERSNRLVQYTQGEIGRHLDSEQDRYGTDSNNATLDVSAKAASLQYNSDEAINTGIEAGKQALFRNVQIKGDHGDQDIVNHALTTASTTVIKGAVEGALANNDPTRANDIMAKFGSQMDPATRAQLAHLTNAHHDAISVDGAANNFVNGITPAQAQAGAADNAFWRRIQGAEGGVNPDGSPRTSSAGAIGRSQLEPGTAAATAAKHGIPYAPHQITTDDSTNTMIGRLTVTDLMQQYGGNQTLVAAAYNAGPGRVNQWIQQFGDPRKGVISDADFANKIPIPETKNYVNKVAQPTAAPSLGSHNPAVYNEEAAKVADAEGQARQLFPDRPDLQDRFVDKVHQHYSMINSMQAQSDAASLKAQKDAEEGAANTVVTSFQTDPTKFDPSTITNNPNLSSSQKLHLMDAYHTELTRQTRGGGGTYGADFNDLFTKVTAPEGDSTRITNAKDLWADLAAGRITPAGYEKLNAELNNRKTPQGEAEVQAKKGVWEGFQVQIESPTIPGEKPDERSKALAGQARMAFDNALEAGKAKGLTYHQLLDEKSPDFIGAAMKPFIRNSAQKLKDMQDAQAADAEQPGQPLPAAQADTAPPPPRFTPDQIHAEMQRRGLLKPAQPAAPTGPQVPTN